MMLATISLSSVFVLFCFFRLSSGLKNTNAELSEKMKLLKGSSLDTLTSENILLKNENAGLCEENSKLKVRTDTTLLFDTRCSAASCFSNYFDELPAITCIVAYLTLSLSDLFVCSTIINFDELQLELAGLAMLCC